MLKMEIQADILAGLKTIWGQQMRQLMQLCLVRGKREFAASNYNVDIQLTFNGEN